MLVTRPSEGSGSYGRNSVALSEGKGVVTDSRRQLRWRGAREVHGDPLYYQVGLVVKSRVSPCQPFEPSLHLLINRLPGELFLPHSEVLQQTAITCFSVVHTIQLPQVIMSILVYMLRMFPVIGQWTSQKKTQQIPL